MITIISTETGVNEVFEDLGAAHAFAKRQDNPTAWALHQRGVISPLDLPADPEPAADAAFAEGEGAATQSAEPIAKPIAKRTAKAK